MAILVEGNGMRRTENLFIQWAPGSVPSLVTDPRTATSLSAPSPPAQTEDPRYFHERRALPETELIKRIWQSPHWRVVIQPNQYLPGNFRNPSECETFVRQRFVTALGNESLPIVTEATAFHTISAPAGVRGETDHAQLPALREAWALFQSAQFVLSRPLPVNRPSPKVIHYRELLHVVMQTFEFARRLAVERDIHGALTIKISLTNVLGQEILVPDRTVSSYCKSDSINESEEFTPLDGADMVGEHALALLLRIYPAFGWHDASKDNLKREQQRLKF